MSGFEYNGQSTATIIDTPLILVSTESLGNIVGSSRSKIEGNITISRPITNEYGTTHDPLSFTYSLMKQDLEPFSTEEQIAVERWLTSPKLSSELRITDCNDDSYSYFGLFTNTEWTMGNGDFAICTFTFQVNGRHCYKYVEYRDSSNRYENEDDPSEVTSIEQEFDIYINNETDELEEYVYPKFEFSAIGRSYNSSIEITNLSEEDTENNSISVTTRRISVIVLDSQNCRIGESMEGVNNKHYIDLFKFKDIGLEDVGNIYWPRLLPGVNHLRIKGYINLKISYYIPLKKVGGWLI